MLQDFSRTENRILGAVARLDDFLMNPLLQGHSGTTPETSRNMFSINQRTNEDDSQSYPHSEADLLISDREDRHDMVKGATEQSRNGHDMVTGVLEEVTYCSPRTSSGKQKKTVLQVNLNFAVKTPLRRLRGTKFCWHFSS